MTPIEDPIDLEAAEYVLGTLAVDERAAFADKLRSSGSAKRAVTDWESRLLGLSGKVEPISPPSTVWPRIERALQDLAEPTRTFEVVDGGGLIADRSPTIATSRNRWRATALVLGSIAAALVAFIAVDRSGPPQANLGDSYVAAVNRGGDKPALLVRVDFKTRQVFVMPVAAETPSGRSLELWYIGDDKTPRAMGIVDKSPAMMSIPTGAEASSATFAVSVEPPGGSTTGGPTGPVVYSGQLIKE